MQLIVNRSCRSKVAAAASLGLLSCWLVEQWQDSLVEAACLLST